MIYFTLENFFGHDKYVNGLNPEAANTTVSAPMLIPRGRRLWGYALAKIIDIRCKHYILITLILKK